MGPVPTSPWGKRTTRSWHEPTVQRYGHTPRANERLDTIVAEPALAQLYRAGMLTAKKAPATATGALSELEGYGATSLRYRAPRSGASDNRVVRSRCRASSNAGWTPRLTPRPPSIPGPASCNTGVVADVFSVIAEERRAAALAAIGSVADPASVIAITPLAGGASAASTLRIDTGSGPYLMRLDGVREGFRDPRRSYPCLRAAAEAGIAPTVHHADEEAAVVLTDFVIEHPLTTYPGGESAARADARATDRDAPGDTAIPGGDGGPGRAHCGAVGPRARRRPVRARCSRRPRRRT